MTMQTELQTTGTQNENVERTINQASAVFRIGYMLSFLFVGIGLVDAVIRDHPLAEELGPPRELLNHLLELDPNGFIGLGIGTMILTPIVMTLSVALNFYRARDLRFAAITGAVSLILIVTLALAFI
jgi:uncharacterized membrane protein